MNGKWCVFAAAPDLTAGFLIANGQSGLFAELFVLAEANKQTRAYDHITPIMIFSITALRTALT